MTDLQMLALFFCTFVNVFFLGLQNRNVNAGRYLPAIITSVCISAANFIFIHFAATGSVVAFGVSAVGGSMGIAGSIWFYQNVMTKKAKAKCNRVADVLTITVEAKVDQAMREVELLRARVALCKSELEELAVLEGMLKNE